MNALLSVERLRYLRASAREGRGFVLDVPRAVLRPGDRIAVIGPNGSGKTTLVDVLSLVLPPDSVVDFRIAAGGPGDRSAAAAVDVRPPWRGRVGAAVSRMRARVLAAVRHAGTEISFLTARDRVALRARLAGHRDIRERVDEALERFGLAALARMKPGALSQGQCQRVALGAALAAAPRIVLADEPTAALDREWEERAMVVLARDPSLDDSAVLITTHKPDLARAFGFTVVEAEVRDGAYATRFEIGEHR